MAEEALGIGLWCALMANCLEEGICWAVNHPGDSDSTGLIAGNLLGIQQGPDATPARWLGSLELREVIEQLAHDIEWVPRTYCGNTARALPRTSAYGNTIPGPDAGGSKAMSRRKHCDALQWLAAGLAVFLLVSA